MRGFPRVGAVACCFGGLYGRLWAFWRVFGVVVCLGVVGRLNGASFVYRYIPLVRAFIRDFRRSWGASRNARVSWPGNAPRKGG